MSADPPSDVINYLRVFWLRDAPDNFFAILRWRSWTPCLNIQCFTQTLLQWLQSSGILRTGRWVICIWPMNRMTKWVTRDPNPVHRTSDEHSVPSLRCHCRH